MQSTFEQIGIEKMSVSDRIDLIGLIWDSIVQSDEKFAIPDWHLRELEKRRTAAEADPDAGVPWEEVKAEMTRSK